MESMAAFKALIDAAKALKVAPQDCCLSSPKSILTLETKEK